MPSKNHPWKKFKFSATDKTLRDYAAILAERGETIVKNTKRAEQAAFGRMMK